MDARPRSLARVALFAALLAPAALAAEPVPAGRLLPLAVRDGRCECVLPTGRPGDKFLLILGSLAPRPGPFRVTVRTAAADGPAAVPLDRPEPDEAWERRVRLAQERQEKGRQAGFHLEEYVPAADPPRRREFSVFVQEREFHSATGYVTVTGELWGVGRRCQVYVDRDHAGDGLRATVDAAVRIFDEEVFARARRELGQACDVDRDGRFTLLFTGWLGRLSGGKVSVGGFVRGSDFYRDLAAPYGNRCDMMYLNTDLKPGPHLRAVLAHEYTHAVVFSEHVFGRYLPEAPRQDEDSWLNEALAHLAEDLHGCGWSNLDYRVSAFLSVPEGYRLVVGDYYADGLWRDPGCRGATYLFLRWCADRHDGLAARLVRSNLCGIANLEAATGERFADLFRRWSAALALGGTGLASDVEPLRHVAVRGPLGGRLLCGPRTDPVSLTDGRHSLRLSGTATAYLLLHSPAGNHTRLTVEAEADAELQATLVRLPEGMARLSLRAEPADGGAVRLHLTAHDAAVTLDGAAWERLEPAVSRPEDTSFRPEQPALETVRAWFGKPSLKAGETRTSAAVALPRSDQAAGPWVFKVLATDAAGHHVTAWAVLRGDD